MGDGLALSFSIWHVLCGRGISGAALCWESCSPGTGHSRALRPLNTPLAGRSSAMSQRASGHHNVLHPPVPDTKRLCHKGPRPAFLLNTLELLSPREVVRSNPSLGHLWALMCPGPCEALGTVPQDSPSPILQSPAFGGWLFRARAMGQMDTARQLWAVAPCPGWAAM